MKLIEILEACLIGGQHHEVGEQVEISDDEAYVLSSCKRVRYVDAAAPINETTVDESNPEIKDKGEK
ncbi:hypothetical protein HQN60_12615 [Deefgea piscis]|uniref:Uncharacterized protein n=1 Tax=Deefgea piscis TaxID=2739061 RepID=A0A6M8SW06_9NEIS|nr:hypothetical protein [Deefgea piscis]QKJ67480.1 hypothetical protein HQN60_12615 [Deefgea piscis]